MIHYIKKEIKLLLYSIIFGALSTYALLNESIILGQVMDIATKTKYGNILNLIPQAILFIFLFVICSTLNIRFTLKFGDNISNHIRENIVKKYYENGIEEFFSYSDSYYINFIDEDIDYIRSSYLYNIPNFLNCIIQAIILSYTLLKIHYIIFLIAIAFSIFPIITGKLVAKPIQKKQEQRSKANDEYMSKLGEVIDGYETIKLSNRPDKFIYNFKNSLENRSLKIRSLNLSNIIGQKAIYVVAVLGTLFVISIGGELVSNGFITAGLLLSSMFIVNDFTDSVRNGAEYFVTIQSCKTLVEKIKSKLVNISKTDRLKKQNNSNEIIKFPIKIKDFSVKIKDRVLFENINIDIEKNDLVAILGHSGSGKSTFAKTIMKYSENYQGEIFFGDIALKNINENDLYNFINYIPQTPFIFKDSLFNNIVMYKEGITETSEKYIDIIKKVSLDEVYNRLKDVDAIDPNKLSGGEKQRIALARALIDDKKLIIFDEPTTGLDPKNSEIINNLIFNLDVSRIVITHNWDEDFLSNFNKTIKI